MNSAPDSRTLQQNATASSDWLAEYPPPRSLPLDQEALRIFERAYAIGMKIESEGPAITFSSLILALLTGEDETSQWFARLAVQQGPTVDLVLAEKGIDRATVTALAPSVGRPERLRLSEDKHILTISARNLLVSAEGWAQRVGGTDIGVRHLVASFVLNPPPAHRAQMQRWGYREAEWRTAFFPWVAGRYTAEQWTDATQRPAPAAATPAFEQQLSVKGEELAYPGDEHTALVLEQAALDHAQRSDRWLRLQTLFHALITTAQQNPAVGSEIEPLMSALDSVQPQYQKVLFEFQSASANRPPVPFDQLDLSPRVLNALETARGLAVAARKDARVGVRHLAGALVSRRVDAEEALSPMGLQVQALRRALIADAEKHGESVEAWSESLGEEDVQAGRPVELNSDDPEAALRTDEAWLSDPLSIRRDVKTFAALLASKTLEPPLSVGLFGPWGSGKTTFLKRLRREVQALADAAGATQGNSPYVSNVVHVDFNAWHFAESALTSSLVDKILRELENFIRDKQQETPAAWRDRALRELETTQRNLQAAKAVETAAKGAVAKAEGELTAARGKAVEATVSFHNLMNGVWVATRAAIRSSKAVEDSGVLDALGSTINSTEELRARVAALRNRPARLLGELGWIKSLIFAFSVLAVPLLIAWLTNSLLNQATSALTTLTAALSMVGLWVRAASGAVAKVDKAVAEVAAEFEKQLAENEEVKTAQQALANAQASAVTAETALEAARQELARAQTELANAELPAQMLQLVSNRLEAQTYAKELTSLSLARADLEGLSRILHAQRQPNAPPAESPLRPVERVILYIDDLDRCKPIDVVRVLQLVHMLLAFELFVVVVAVDARWVEESLKHSFDWLADGPNPATEATSNGAARARMDHLSPQDYLEKIFQIVFWLEPMTVSRAADYLGSLVRASTRESGPVYGTIGESMPTAPAKVEIAALELDYMRYLAAHVGSSPRRVKRFVNAYRLIKAGMSDAELRAFLTERMDESGAIRSGPYQVVIGLLVIGTGAPGSSAQILTELAECHPGAMINDVVERLRARKHPDWTMAAQVIEALMQSQKAEDVRDLRGWARRVRRFLLNGGGYSAAGLIREEVPVAVAAPSAVP